MNDKNKPETGVVINAQGRTTAAPGTIIKMGGRLYIVNELAKVVPYKEPVKKRYPFK